MVWYTVRKEFLQEQISTTIRTQIILPRPDRDWSVGLADRHCHCAIAQNVCSAAVYESLNFAYEKWIMGENL